MFYKKMYMYVVIAMITTLSFTTKASFKTDISTIVDITLLGLVGGVSGGCVGLCAGYALLKKSKQSGGYFDIDGLGICGAFFGAGAGLALGGVAGVALGYKVAGRL